MNLSGHLDEVGEDPNADPNAAPGGDPNSTPAPGGDPAAIGGDPNAMGAAPGVDQAADPNAAGGPSAMGDDPAAGGESGAEGFDPQVGDDMGGDPAAIEDPTAGMEQPGPDDNVIDIDDLTNAQDETNMAVQDLSSKFEKLLGVVDKFEKFIDKNDSEIESLRQELEKRNPTPLEKLDLRTVNDSYPFNVKPNDYWKDKEETSNYRVGGDPMEVTDQYDLHQSDVDNVSNWKEIADSLDDSDLTDLTKIFGI